MKLLLDNKLSMKDDRTQGQKKLSQYLEDLRRNEIFIAKLKLLKKALKNKPKYIDDHIEELEELADEQAQNYEIYKQSKQKYNQVLYTDINELYKEISEEYQIDYGLISLLLSKFSVKTGSIKLSELNDFCIIKDNYKQLMYINNYEEEPIIGTYDDVREAHVYPTSIHIHRFSSQRDILNFVEKRWRSIEDVLKKYRGNKPVRFRQRKYSQEFRDHIWEDQGQNQTSKKREPKEADLDKIRKELDEHNLSHFDIPKLKSLEKKRRSRKINVGQ